MERSSLAGRVIWITGLSGAGKTTLARALMPHLPSTSVLLDGDELREALGAATSGFDYESRKALAFTYARFARLLAKQGLTVVVATISLFHELHAWNREHLPQYLEVFLDVTEDVRRERDPKGLYAAEAQGRQKNMAGGETAVEIPLRPDITLRHAETPQLSECLAKVLACVKKTDQNCQRQVTG